MVDDVAVFRRQLQAMQAQLAGMQHSVAGMLALLPDARSDPRAHAGAETFDDNDGGEEFGDAYGAAAVQPTRRPRKKGKQSTAAR